MQNEEKDRVIRTLRKRLEHQSKKSGGSGNGSSPFRSEAIKSVNAGTQTDRVRQMLLCAMLPLLLLLLCHSSQLCCRCCKLKISFNVVTILDVVVAAIYITVVVAVAVTVMNAG